MTKVYLITGFLGAGKTSFLQNILNQNDSKIGILMNEFGKVNIDGITLENQDVSMLQLTNGSIFCSCLKEHFIEGLIELINKELDYIFVESSGLADPSDMGKVLQVVNKEVNNHYIFEGTICLIDGVHFEKELDMMVSVERQIKHSHAILINKIDLIDQEHLELIVDKIVKINPKANIYKVTFGRVHLADLENMFFRIEDEITTNREDNRPRTLLIKLKYDIKMKQLEDLLEASVHDFFRIKGYLSIEGKQYKVDAVNNTIDIKENSGCNKVNELVFLASKGITSISTLAKAADKYIPGLFSLEM